MRALTIRQPYADAIVWGAKRVENRSRPLSDMHLGKMVFIHAALAPHASKVTAADLGLDHAPDVRGAVIGTAVLDSCHQNANGCCAPWGMAGFWHWVLRDVRPLPRPVPAVGMLGLWTPTPDVLHDVQVQFWETTPTSPGAAS